jgi:hypothetical protein
MFETKIYWHNAEQDILIMEVNGDSNDWDWKKSYAATETFKAEAESVGHPIYTILIFHNNPPIPKDSIFANIKRLMDIHPKNEVLAFFVGTNRFFSKVLNTAAQIYGFRAILGNFRFVLSKAEALETIEAHRKIISQHSSF